MGKKKKAKLRKKARPIGKILGMEGLYWYLDQGNGYRAWQKRKTEIILVGEGGIKHINSEAAHTESCPSGDGDAHARLMSESHGAYWSPRAGIWISRELKNPQSQLSL